MLPSFCWLPCSLWLSPRRRSSCGGHWRCGHGSSSLSRIVDVIVQTRNFFRLSQFTVRNHHVTLFISFDTPNSTTLLFTVFTTSGSRRFCVSNPRYVFLFFFSLSYYILINRQGTTCRTTPSHQRMATMMTKTGQHQLRSLHQLLFLFLLILNLIYY
jgi:hypothetical protein